jgi:hypothetical protein
LIFAIDATDFLGISLEAGSSPGSIDEHEKTSETPVFH